MFPFYVSSPYGLIIVCILSLLSYVYTTYCRKTFEIYVYTTSQQRIRFNELNQQQHDLSIEIEKTEGRSSEFARCSLAKRQLVKVNNEMNTLPLILRHGSIPDKLFTAVIMHCICIFILLCMIFIWLGWVPLLVSPLHFEQSNNIDINSNGDNNRIDIDILSQKHQQYINISLISYIFSFNPILLYFVIIYSIQHIIYYYKYVIRLINNKNIIAPVKQD